MPGKARPELHLPVLAALGIVLCCGGPVLMAWIAVGGATTFLASGVLPLAAIALAGAVAAALVYARSARTPEADECCAPKREAGEGSR